MCARPSRRESVTRTLGSLWYSTLHIVLSVYIIVSDDVLRAFLTKEADIYFTMMSRWDQAARARSCTPAHSSADSGDAPTRAQHRSLRPPPPCPQLCLLRLFRRPCASEYREAQVRVHFLLVA